MNKVRRMRIHRFGGKEVLQVDSLEPSLPDATNRTGRDDAVHRVKPQASDQRGMDRKHIQSEQFQDHSANRLDEDVGD